MVTRIRTSLTDPLQIAAVTPKDGRGATGITFCPGKRQPMGMTGAWARDLEADVAAIRAWGADIVVTLITATELEQLRVERLGDVVESHGMRWVHLPIEDYAIPDAAFETAWPAASARLHETLDEGGRVLIHCKGGLGRAGTVAAMLLVERGDGPSMALCRVREVRPGAVETDEQEQYVIAHAVERAGGKPSDRS